MRFLSLILSFLVVAFGQPAYFSWLCPVAAGIGTALFFYAVDGLKRRFLFFALWFAGIQLVQLSWMTSIEFQGIYILFVYAGIAIWLGLQFGLLSFFIPSTGALDVRRMLAVSGLWTLLEWTRLFVLCGLSLNPLGLALTGQIYSLQCASVFGVLGLTFLVMLTNLLALRVLRQKTLGKEALQWVIVLACPYLIGCGLMYMPPQTSSVKKEIALIQTGLLPSEKIPLPDRKNEFISPIAQWRSILRLLAEKKKSSWDLIAFPEASLPFLADWAYYPYEEILALFINECGKESITALPPLEPPFAFHRVENGKIVSRVTNLFFAQALSNLFSSEVIVGFDCHDRLDEKSYNSAFYLIPGNGVYKRYDKQVLLPLGEYLPFEILKPLTKSYGIFEFFSHGKQTQVFGQKVPFAVSICYEETFSELIREGKKMGAHFLVNLTNDNYYPNSMLAEQHLYHARVRAVENGMPLVRSCNSGVTSVVDRFGRILSRLGNTREASEKAKGVLDFSLPITFHPTLYSFFGDGGIVVLSIAFLTLFIRPRGRRYFASGAVLND